jgi:hypothetical protein
MFSFVTFGAWVGFCTYWMLFAYDTHGRRELDLMDMTDVGNWDFGFGLGLGIGTCYV